MAADQGEGFEHYRKPTMRNAFLATMEEIVIWKALCGALRWASTLPPRQSFRPLGMQHDESPRALLLPVLGSGMPAFHILQKQSECRHRSFTPGGSRWRPQVI